MFGSYPGAHGSLSHPRGALRWNVGCGCHVALSLAREPMVNRWYKYTISQDGFSSQLLREHGFIYTSATKTTPSPRSNNPSNLSRFINQVQCVLDRGSSISRLARPSRLSTVRRSESTWRGIAWRED